MLHESQIKNTLYLDIETAGLFSEFQELVELNPTLADLWRKRCEWLNKADGTSSSPEILWEKKSALHPEFARIVCVSVGYVDSEGTPHIKTISEEDETLLLMQLRDQLNKITQMGWKIAGHTIKNFDIPFIGKRMLIRGIDPPSCIQVFNKKPWETGFLDIAEIFGFGAYGQTHTSLDLMCCVLGVESPKKEISGEDVHRSYWEGEINKIIEYCEGDVAAVISCFKKM